MSQETTHRERLLQMGDDKKRRRSRGVIGGDLQNVQQQRELRSQERRGQGGRGHASGVTSFQRRRADCKRGISMGTF
jgi:hypothetical protein